MNHRYASAAVVKDGTPEPAFAHDKELFYSATTWPGAHLPHVWLDRRGERISTLDLCGKGRFTLLTGIGGEAWVAAAVSKAMGAEIAAYVIGPERDAVSIYADWPDTRETEDSGCLLVRPDMVVAFRAPRITAEAEGELRQALAQILLCA